MFESALRFFFPTLLVHPSRMSMSDEETDELEAQHDDNPSEYGSEDAQNDNDVVANIQMFIEKSGYIAQMEGCEGDFEEDGGIHNETAETEPMDEESCSDFSSMWQTVQKITEELHSKKIAFETLMARLHEHSHLYKIEILVNQHFSNLFVFRCFSSTMISRKLEFFRLRKWNADWPHFLQMGLTRFSAFLLLVDGMYCLINLVR